MRAHTLVQRRPDLESQWRLPALVTVQRSAVLTPSEPASLTEGVHAALESGGQALDQDVLATMETRLGHDFSQVAIHTDARAEESAAALSARAYTVGRDVVFGPGAYNPRTSEGQELLAHELTHVAQQAAGPVAGAPVEEGLAVSDASDPYEQAAEQTARASAGARAAGSPASGEGQPADTASVQLSVQRCGATPCGCSPEERQEHALRHAPDSEVDEAQGGGESPRLRAQRLVVQRDDDDDPRKPDVPKPQPGLTDQYGPFDPNDKFFKFGWDKGKPSVSVDPGIVGLPGQGDPLKYSPPDGSLDAHPMAKPAGCPDERWNKPGPWNLFTSTCCNPGTAFNDASHKCEPVQQPSPDLGLPPVPPAPPPEYNDLPAPDPNIATV